MVDAWTPEEREIWRLWGVIRQLQERKDNPLGDYLLRVWGRDCELVATLRAPDARESGQTVLCYWFSTADERETFSREIPQTYWIAKNCVNPSEHDGEHIDTHLQTYARVHLRLPDGREGTFEESFGYGYPAYAARSMWESGNYSCDCNKRLFLARYCGIDSENDDMDAEVSCGDTIELVSLEITKR